MSHSDNVPIIEQPDPENIYPTDTFLDLNDDDINLVYPAMMTFLSAYYALGQFAQEYPEEYRINIVTGTIELVDDITGTSIWYNRTND